MNFSVLASPLADSTAPARMTNMAEQGFPCSKTCTHHRGDFVRGRAGPVAGDRRRRRPRRAGRISRKSARSWPVSLAEVGSNPNSTRIGPSVRVRSKRLAGVRRSFLIPINLESFARQGNLHVQQHVCGGLLRSPPTGVEPDRSPLERAVRRPPAQMSLKIHIVNQPMPPLMQSMREFEVQRLPVGVDDGAEYRNQPSRVRHITARLWESSLQSG